MRVNMRPNGSKKTLKGDTSKSRATVQTLLMKDPRIDQISESERQKMLGIIREKSKTCSYEETCAFTTRTLKEIIGRSGDLEPVAPNHPLQKFKLLGYLTKNMFEIETANDTQQIKQLLEEEGDEFLCSAASHGKAGLLDKLFSLAREQDHRFTQNPLLEATKNNASNVASSLIKHFEEVNLRDDNGNTPLHYASQHGNTQLILKIVTQLKKAPGLDFNPMNQAGYTPLHLAAEEGHAVTVQYLLDVLIEQQQTISPINPTDMTTPFLAAARAEKFDVVAIFLENPKFLEERNPVLTEAGETLFQRALAFEHGVLLKPLLKILYHEWKARGFQTQDQTYNQIFAAFVITKQSKKIIQILNDERAIPKEIYLKTGLYWAAFYHQETLANAIIEVSKKHMACDLNAVLKLVNEVKAESKQKLPILTTLSRTISKEILAAQRNLQATVGEKAAQLRSLLPVDLPSAANPHNEERLEALHKIYQALKTSIDQGINTLKDQCEQSALDECFVSIKKKIESQLEKYTPQKADFLSEERRVVEASVAPHEDRLRWLENNSVINAKERIASQRGNYALRMRLASHLEKLKKAMEQCQNEINTSRQTLICFSPQCAQLDQCVIDLEGSLTTFEYEAVRAEARKKEKNNAEEHQKLSIENGSLLAMAKAQRDRIQEQLNKAINSLRLLNSEKKQYEQALFHIQDALLREEAEIKCYPQTTLLEEKTLAQQLYNLTDAQRFHATLREIAEIQRTLEQKICLIHKKTLEEAVAAAAEPIEAVAAAELPRLLEGMTLTPLYNEKFGSSCAAPAQGPRRPKKKNIKRNGAYHAMEPVCGETLKLLNNVLEALAQNVRMANEIPTEKKINPLLLAIAIHFDSTATEIRDAIFHHLLKIDVTEENYQKLYAFSLSLLGPRCARENKESLCEQFFALFPKAEQRDYAQLIIVINQHLEHLAHYANEIKEGRIDIHSDLLTQANIASSIALIGALLSDLNRASDQNDELSIKIGGKYWRVYAILNMHIPTFHALANSVRHDGPEAICAVVEQFCIALIKGLSIETAAIEAAAQQQTSVRLG